MKDSRDSGISPLAWVELGMTSSLRILRLPRLNIVAVMDSLSVSNDDIGLSLNSPFVRNRPVPSIQVHLKEEVLGGFHGGCVDQSGFDEAIGGSVWGGEGGSASLFGGLVCVWLGEEAGVLKGVAGFERLPRFKE